MNTLTSLVIYYIIRKMFSITFECRFWFQHACKLLHTVQCMAHTRIVLIVVIDRFHVIHETVQFYLCNVCLLSMHCLCVYNLQCQSDANFLEKTTTFIKHTHSQKLNGNEKVEFSWWFIAAGKARSKKRQEYENMTHSWAKMQASHLTSLCRHINIGIGIHTLFLL